MNITEQQLTALVRSWQSEHGLEVDGILGPLTRASIRRFYNLPDTSPFMNRTISYALADVGEVEVGRNGGPYVHMLRRFCGFPEDMLGAWCAIFGSAKFKRAWKSIQFPERPWLALPFELSRGAYRLVMNVGEAGRFIDVPEPGVACWKRRGWLLFRKAHFRFITGYDAGTDTMHCVAGNEKDGVRVVTLKNGAWRKDLLKMATI